MGPVDVPAELTAQVASALVGVIEGLRGHDLVAVDVVYHAMHEADLVPTPVEIAACSRECRDRILHEQPAPAGLVYVWSNLEFDVYAEHETADRLLAPAWQRVNDFAQHRYATYGRDEDEDGTEVPRAVLIAVCRGFNDGRWTWRRPAHIAPDAVIYPAARAGVDPDTGGNLRAALSVAQQQRLEAAGLMLAY
jgi:hypothetical protein